MKVVLSHLSKTFVSLRGKQQALRDVTLEIADKELFVLLGPSGCGKSTLLNVIAGLEKPTKGEVRFGDKLVASAEKNIALPPRKRNVAMVFQSYALYPHMNVFDNIAFPLRISKADKNVISEEVHRAAATLEVADLLPAKPRELSGGQRQRVAIARAIVRHPDLFLLDEPLSNLDARLRLSMRTELKNLQKRLNITTVYVTHDQIEAMTLGDRIGVLRDGALEQVGSALDLYNHPVNAFVGQFIGSPPMNLIKMELRQDSDRFYLESSDLRVDFPRSENQSFGAFEPGPHTIGIRPEDIRIVSEASPRSVGMKIAAVESLGREQLLHGIIGDMHLAILAPQGQYLEGDHIDIELSPRRLHIFDENR